MSHQRIIGKCGRCKSDVLSVRDMKDHTVGEPNYGTALVLGAYLANQEFRAGWAKLMCSGCLA